MVNENNNNSNKLYDIFFSYSPESKELVDLLSKNLKNDLNYKIYFDNNITTNNNTSHASSSNSNPNLIQNSQSNENFNSNTNNRKHNTNNFNKKLKFLNQSKCMLSLVTKKYCESIECLKEISFASQTNKPLILLMLEDLNMNKLETKDSNNNKYHIEPYLKIDLFKQNENKEEMIESMIESIQLNLDKLNKQLQSNSNNNNTSTANNSNHHNSNNNLISSSSTISLNNKMLNESFCDDNRCETYVQIHHHPNMSNKKVSQGILTFSNGDKYEGDLVNNKKHGRGVYTYRNGDVYDGEW